MNKLNNETSEKCYVGFLDILGFKDFVENNSHKELIENFDFIIDKVFSTHIEGYNNSNRGKIGSEQFLIEVLFISDSIILWTKNEFQGSFVKLLNIVSDLIAISFRTGLPLRGGISFGELHTYKNSNNTTVIGKGLINAYKIEETQNWAGCIVDKIAIDELNIQNSFLPEIKKITYDDLINVVKILQEYDVPLKSGISERNYVVNWTNNVNVSDYLNEDFIRKSFSMHNKSVNDSRVQSKINNTIDYFKSNEKNNKSPTTNREDGSQP